MPEMSGCLFIDDNMEILTFIWELVVLIAVLYLVFFMIPELKEKYDSCNLKILCQSGDISKEDCKILFPEIEIVLPSN